MVGDTPCEGEPLEEETVEKEQQDVLQFKIHDSGTLTYLLSSLNWYIVYLL